MSSPSSSERTSALAASEKPIRERQMAAYHRALPHVEGRHVLEIGCGEGIGASVLARSASNVVALDYSEETLSFARENFSLGNIEFVLMKVPPIEVDDASFDAVVCFQMIEHLEEPDGLVSEVRRIIRNDGVALFATVNKEETLSDNPYHVHEFNAKEFKELLEAHFGSVEVYGVFGDEAFMRYWEGNRKWVRNFMRIDVLNLSSLLPSGIRQWLFDNVSRLMRARLKQSDPALCDRITHESFTFRQNAFEGCLDFFAICRKM